MVASSITGELVVGGFGILAALITGLVTFVETRRTFINDLTKEYDLALRANRVEVYPALWQLTEALPRYGKERPLTVADLVELIESVRGWYFERGGMFLSGESREAYFAFQKGLSATARERDGSDPVDAGERDRLRDLGSALRTSLTLDVRTRRGSELSKAEESGLTV
ncbi:MAG: hypothetical protein QOE36_1540 [Gaiellaceae bacterium]|jgi:hypothetical protein|nr:hypothetical protein [Gaiellaceae bacterium]